MGESGSRQYVKWVKPRIANRALLFNRRSSIASALFSLSSLSGDKLVHGGIISVAKPQSLISRQCNRSVISLISEIKSKLAGSVVGEEAENLNQKLRLKP